MRRTMSSMSQRRMPISHSSRSENWDNSRTASRCRCQALSFSEIMLRVITIDSFSGAVRPSGRKPIVAGAFNGHAPPAMSSAKARFSGAPSPVFPNSWEAQAAFALAHRLGDAR